MRPEQAQLYPRIAYYALRPEITGGWQVSVAADFVLLLATVRPVLHGAAH